MIINQNKKLKSFLKEINKMVLNASTSSDFDEIFYKLKLYDRKIKFKNKIPILISILSSISFIYIFYLLFFTNFFGGSNLLVFTMYASVPAIFFISSISYIFSRNDTITNISNNIFNKDIYFDNNLKVIRINDGNLMWKQLNSIISDFNRGNSSQKIFNLAKGKLNDLEYELHSFYYENVSTYPVITIVNNTPITRMSENIASYNIYGLISDFSFDGEISIFSNGNTNLPKIFRSSNNKFNQQFIIRTSNTSTAARFLIDSVTEAIINLHKSSDDLNIEIKNNKICITYSNDIIFTNKRKFGIESPVLFEKEINEHRNLIKLKILLETITILMKYKDNRNILKKKYKDNKIFVFFIKALL